MTPSKAKKVKGASFSIMLASSRRVILRAQHRRTVRRRRRGGGHGAGSQDRSDSGVMRWIEEKGSVERWPGVLLPTVQEARQVDASDEGLPHTDIHTERGHSPSTQTRLRIPHEKTVRKLTKERHPLSLWVSFY
jgi:hypothetical protein